MNRLIIIGASGHGKVVADIAKLCGYSDIVFLDDDESRTECAGYPVVGRTSEAPDGDVFVAIGNNEIRRMYFSRYAKRVFPSLIHPKSVVASDVTIGRGTVVMACAVINPGTTIGSGCIINTCSSIDHDCSIGDFVHVSVGARICGTVSIEENTWIGAGATIINNVKICDSCLIGAGAVVTNDIVERGVFVGVPARRCK